MISDRTASIRRSIRAGLSAWVIGRRIVLGSAAAACLAVVFAGESPAVAKYRRDIEPILSEFCFDCHADGAKKGEVAFDEWKDAETLLNHDLWLKALKNVRAGLMPPPKKSQPSAEQRAVLEKWIKDSAFEIDPDNLDPGRATVRRLNRVEYRNTVRDLIGVNFDTEAEFPPDDTGHGFDNIADVLTLSPMLLEKYLDAARTIIAQAVPSVPAVVQEKRIPGRAFTAVVEGERGNRGRGGGSLSLSYYDATKVTNVVHIDHPGRYKVQLDMNASERFVDNQFDYNKCELIFRVDGEELLRREFVREGGKPFRFEYDREWKAGDHELVFEVRPLTPDEPKIRSLAMRVNAVTVQGPFDEKFFVRPANYEKFFPKTPPQDEEGRRAYARELLEPFATRAFRRPVDDATVDRLAALAELVYTQPKQTFEAGISQAMVAVLASPRFLFREEEAESSSSNEGHPLVDEYALATRLSYFLWSTMPDAELFRLAGQNALRKNLPAQIERMLADSRSAGLIENFSGQWLQARDIDSVQINARAVLRRDSGQAGNQRGGRRGQRDRGPNIELTPELRRAMREETELYFGYIVRENRSVLELLDSNYTFLNERLAAHYGLTNLAVTGQAMRRVTLPVGNPRGGVLTHGSVLAVTSNPNRTSPVKRGVFILDNILGTPPPPPPPDIPSLEEAGNDIKDRTLSLRESLELHRDQPLCSSCHKRMDPLGLALENFNALGMWRSQELQQPIDPSGTLITGESFTNVQSLKRILATNHKAAFYHTIAEKLLTYSLGRGLEYYDVETLDGIVHRLEKEEGRFSALLMGVIDSAPFQKIRKPGAPEIAHADANLKPGENFNR